MRGALLIIAACLALAIAGCGDDDSSTTAASGEETAAAEQPEKKTKPKVTVPSGAPSKRPVAKDLEVGTGRTAKAGDEVGVQYVGVGYKTKKEFDASWDRGEPFYFTLGAGEVIRGWDEGIVGMKEGGRRELILPPSFAYGPAGSPPAIGPNETLIFIVDLETVE